MERILVTRTWTLVALAAAFAATPAAAHAASPSGSGGAGVPASEAGSTTPSPTSSAPAPGSTTAPANAGSGGASYRPDLKRARARSKARRKRRDRPVLASFQVSRTALFAYGKPASVTFQVNDRSRFVRVRLAFVREGSPGAVYRYDLGRKRTGVLHTFRWRGTDGQELATQGSYHFRISARDPDGNRLVRSSQSIGGAPVEFRSHRFPVPGPHDFGGEGARFGAPRSGHRHQGQDIAAAEGSPVVAPRGGIVTWRAYQENGAGYYLVIAGETENYNYVFMHLQRGSLLVNKGEYVKTGQQIANVGNTGASEGAHLHFEIWQGPWFNGGKPIDPLPLLQIWDSYS
jgi:murein DD-endopeptidase MepM/ murein hydrolase activator NlpD